MRKLIFIFIGIVVSGFANYSYCQSKIGLIDKVESRIEDRDSILSEISKKNILIDSLYSQINDYDLLVDLYYSENENLKQIIHSQDSTLNFCNRMLSTDQSVFSGSGFDLSQVPLCLRQHLTLVNKTIKAEQLITATEDKLLKLNDALGMPLIENKDLVVNIINSPVKEIKGLLKELLQSDLSTFTTSQKQYIKPGLTERYNNFLIFFE